MAGHRKAGTARAPSKRQLRVGELLRHRLAEIFSRDEINDPALKGLTITVSEVAVSPDLRKANAYVMPLGGDRGDQVLAALKRARRFLRGRIGHSVELKYVPDLDFSLDTSFDYSEAVRDLLALPGVRRDLEAEGGD